MFGPQEEAQLPAKQPAGLDDSWQKQLAMRTASCMDEAMRLLDEASELLTEAKKFYHELSLGNRQQVTTKMRNQATRGEAEIAEHLDRIKEWKG